MMPASVRSKSANRIQKYFGVLMLVERDSQEPELRFCSGGRTTAPLPVTGILVVLSPLDDDLLCEMQSQFINSIRFAYVTHAINRPQGERSDIIKIKRVKVYQSWRKVGRENE